MTPDSTVTSVPKRTLKRGGGGGGRRAGPRTSSACGGCGACGGRGGGRRGAIGRRPPRAKWGGPSLAVVDRAFVALLAGADLEFADERRVGVGGDVDPAVTVAAGAEAHGVGRPAAALLAHHGGDVADQHADDLARQGLVLALGDEVGAVLERFGCAGGHWRGQRR